MIDSKQLKEIVALDSIEKQAQQMYIQWQSENQKIALDSNRIPISRPQGFTIVLNDFVIAARDVFQPLEGISLTKHPRYFTSVFHSHDFFEIIFVLQGHCRQLIDCREFILEQGDMCIIPPGVAHAPEAFSPDDVVINLQLRKDSFRNTFSKLLMPESAVSEFFMRVINQAQPGQCLIFRLNNDSEIFELIIKMFWEYQKKQPFYYEVLQAYVMLFFSRVLREHYKDAMVYSVNDNSNNGTIVQIIAYIEEHPQDVSLKHLSDQFNYNQSHLSRMIKHYTGDNFTVFRRKVRLRKAAKLLQSSELTVEQIASQIGYRNLSDFYAFFKDFYHETPNEYRKQNKQ